MLTPLVDGIRVRGPFFPLLPDLQGADRLVFLDGQGLGHTAESVSSVSTKVTKRFGNVDVILLVDSAQQPMQAAPLALLRAAGSAGYADKIAVAFSHFDQVKGDNLRTMTQKRNHLLASITSAVANLRQVLGATVASALEKRLDENVFLLGGMDREIETIPTGVLREVKRLLVQLQSAVAPVAPVEAAPVYTTSGLELVLRDAVDAASFLRPWEARLGLAYRDGIRAEHQHACQGSEPPFRQRLGRRVRQAFVPQATSSAGCRRKSRAGSTAPPAGRGSLLPTTVSRMAALNPVRNGVFTALNDLVMERLSHKHTRDWLNSYTYSGKGSAMHFRSVEIPADLRGQRSANQFGHEAPAARAFLTEDDRHREGQRRDLRRTVRGAEGCLMQS